jgi:hypothetical protein
VVERVGRGADGSDLLFVRRQGTLRRGLVTVAAGRVATIDPWTETLSLARGSYRVRRPRPAREAVRRQRGPWLAPRLAPLVDRAGAGTAYGSRAFLESMDATWTLCAELAGATRARTPGARRAIASATQTGLALGGAYASAGRKLGGAYARAGRKLAGEQLAAVTAQFEARRRARVEAGPVEAVAAAPRARDDSADGAQPVVEADEAAPARSTSAT